MSLGSSASMSLFVEWHAGCLCFPLEGSFVCELIVTQCTDSYKVMVSDFLAVSGCFILKINYYFLFFQLRAQNQVLKKGVVDEQANSAALKVGYCLCCES